MTWGQIQYPALAEPVGDPSDFIEPVFFDGWNQPVNQPVRAVEYRYELPSVFYLGEPDDFAPAFDTFGWEQPTEQPLLVTPDTRHQHPSTFLEIDPGDFVEPLFADAWIQPLSLPVLPIEFRFTLPSIFYQGEPGDFVEPGVFATFGWEQLHQQPLVVRPDARHLYPSMFVEIEPGDFVESVFFEAWVQPIAQPVLPVEFRYLLPNVFTPDFEEIISSDSGVFFEAWVQPLSEPVLPLEYRYLLPSVFVQIDPDNFAVVGTPATKMPLRVLLDNSGKARLSLANSGKTRLDIS